MIKLFEQVKTEALKLFIDYLLTLKKDNDIIFKVLPNYTC